MTRDDAQKKFNTQCVLGYMTALNASRTYSDSDKISKLIISDEKDFSPIEFNDAFDKSAWQYGALGFFRRSVIGGCLDEKNALCVADELGLSRLAVSYFVQNDVVWFFSYDDTKPSVILKGVDGTTRGTGETISEAVVMAENNKMNVHMN